MDSVDDADSGTSDNRGPAPDEPDRQHVGRWEHIVLGIATGVIVVMLAVIVAVAVLALFGYQMVEWQIERIG